MNNKKKVVPPEAAKNTGKAVKPHHSRNETEKTLTTFVNDDVEASNIEHVDPSQEIVFKGGDDSKKE